MHPYDSKPRTLTDRRKNRNLIKWGAEALDQNRGSLYYNQERYDDFYYGKGSNFILIRASDQQWILFESRRVSKVTCQERQNGMLAFPLSTRSRINSPPTFPSYTASQRNAEWS